MKENFEQIINLEKGENWISFNIIPNNKSIYTFFDKKFLSNGDSISSKKKKSIYNEKKGWTGHLKTLDGDMMYIFNVKKSFVLKITGKRLDNINNIILNKGKNWIAYNNYNKVNIKNIFKNMSDGDYIQHKNNKIVYKNKNWTKTNLTHLEPYKSYIIYVKNPNTYEIIIKSNYKPNKKVNEIEKEEVIENFTKSKKTNTYIYIILFIIIIIIYLFLRKK
jgi:hypothetical protein